MHSKVITPKQVIRDIRETKYGITSSGKQREDFKAISSDLKSAIAQLSTGLYGEDVHFILELIQNAEDNKYDHGVTPDLRFVLLDKDPMGTPGSDGCLCVYNNELGFSEENVRSVCATGKSTKTKVQGYIGEKGIGFKSVFTATDEPHVFSNGYQFKFKGEGVDKNIELSFVVPYWLDEVPSVANKPDYNTCLLLPIKASQRQMIEKELSRIDPESILFLSKLENLSVSLEGAGRSIELVRDISPSSCVDLLINRNDCEEPIKSYWLSKKTIAVPSDIHESKRDGIVDREVTVAFPLSNRGCKGTLYAYLPTEIESGFPFFVNADFMLTANRESIQINRPWSQWLRDSISDVVVQGLQELARDESKRSLICRFIPIRKHLKALDEFLSPVCDAVCEQVQELALVLASTGELIKPERARMVTKDERAVLQDCVDQITFTHYKMIDSQLDSLSDQLRAIGVRELSVGDLKACLKDDAWLNKQNVEWFSSLYEFLHKAQKLKSTDYTGLPITKLESGVAKVAEEAAYIGSSSAVEIKDTAVLVDVGFPGVNLVDPSLCLKLHSNHEVLQWCQDKLGWLYFSEKQYFLNTILEFLIEKIDELTVDQVLTATSGFMRTWDKLDEEERERVTENLPLVLDDGEIILNEYGINLVTPRAYDKERGWQNIFLESIDYEHFNVLSDLYLDQKPPINRATLKEYFDAIGVVEFPKPTLLEIKKGEKFGNKFDPYIDALWSNFSETYSYIPKLNMSFPPIGFMDKDIRSDEVFRKSFICWLEANVSETPSFLRSAKPYKLSFSNDGIIKYYYYSSKKKNVNNICNEIILDAAWIDTTLGFRKPREVFIESQSIVDMFGRSLPFLKDSMSRELCQALGIKSEVTIETIVDYLKELSSSGAPDFKSLKKIYKYLSDYGSDLKEYFSEISIIYVPATGKWYRSSEVVWDDDSSVLGDLYGWLSSDYESAELRDFFVTKIGIKSSVDTEALAKAWLQLQDNGALDAKEIESKLSKIIPKLVSLVKSGAELPEWWDEFEAKVHLWTRDDTFNNPDEIYYSDNRYLAGLFADYIYLAWIPDAGNSVAYYAPLFDRLGVRPMSEVVSHSFVSNEAIFPEANPKILTDFSKRLLAYLVRNDSEDDFEERLNSSLGVIIKSVEVMVNDLTINYRLDEVDIDIQVSDRHGYCDLSRQMIIARALSDREEVKDDVAEFIARSIWGTRYRNNEDKVKAVLGVSNESRYKKLRDKKDWSMPPALMSRIKQLIDQGELIEESSIKSDEPDEKPREATAPLQPDSGSRGQGLPSGRVSPPSHGHATGATLNDTSSGGTASSVSSSAASSRAKSYGSGSTSGQSHGKNHNSGGGSGGGSYKSRSKELTSSINRQKQRRIVTYIYPGSDQEVSENGSENQQVRTAIGDAAENFVVLDEQEQRRNASRMPTGNPGYDIESVDPETGEFRYIEVKGIDSFWGARGVGISSTQFNCALDKGDSYWLYVVEHCRSESPVLHRFCNPAKLIGEYRLDDGWRLLSTGAEIIGKSETFEGLELVDLTDDPDCKQIIRQCLDSNIPVPEVGYEVLNANGAVVAGFELAWAEICIAIRLDETETALPEGWSVYSSEKIGTVFDALVEAFEQRVED